MNDNISEQYDCFAAGGESGTCSLSVVIGILQMARKKAAKAAELEEDALIVEYLRQRQLKEQVCLPSALPSSKQVCHFLCHEAVCVCPLL